LAFALVLARDVTKCRATTLHMSITATRLATTRSVASSIPRRSVTHSPWDEKKRKMKREKGKKGKGKHKKEKTKKKGTQR
jgi:hypothetical protein